LLFVGVQSGSFHGRIDGAPLECADRDESFFETDFLYKLGETLLIVPMSALPSVWEVAIYTLCVPLIFAFVRFELAMKWLVIPFLMMACALFVTSARTP